MAYPVGQSIPFVYFFIKKNTTFFFNKEMAIKNVSL